MARRSFVGWQAHRRFEAGVIVLGHFKIPVGWVLGVVALITGGLILFGVVGTFVLDPLSVDPTGYEYPDYALFQPLGWWALGLFGVGVLFGVYAFFAWTARVFAVAQRSG